jgi:DNA polymerase III subunit delta
MTVIKHKDLRSHLERLSQKKDLDPAYLIYGEEVLVKKALQTTLNLLMPGASKHYGYEAWEGSPENVLEAVRQVNTYALLDKGKVVALLDTPLFAAGQKGLGSPEVNPMKASAPDKVSDMLAAALVDTFPDRHYLIMTAASVDKRRRLYKIMEKSGLVVDCSVPKGDRQADRVAQDAVLRESMQERLSTNDKVLDASAYAALCEMTGFDIRTFLNNLDKLIDYIGDRKKITIDDVSTVLERTRQDPIYAFTNALSERNLADTLFYMDSLLSNGYHALQLIAASVNLMRRLLVIKTFADKAADGIWQNGMSYNAFRDRVMPLVQVHDQDLKEKVMGWDQALSESRGAEQRPKKQRVGTDLLIAPNPKNAYPVYKMTQRATAFSASELLEALKVLSRSDGHLKSSGHPPRSILADAVLQICQGS